MIYHRLNPFQKHETLLCLLHVNISLLTMAMFRPMIHIGPLSCDIISTWSLGGKYCMLYIVSKLNLMQIFLINYPSVNALIVAFYLATIKRYIEIIPKGDSIDSQTNILLISFSSLMIVHPQEMFSSIIEVYRYSDRSQIDGFLQTSHVWYCQHEHLIHWKSIRISLNFC